MLKVKNIIKYTYNNLIYYSTKNIKNKMETFNIDKINENNKNTKKKKTNSLKNDNENYKETKDSNETKESIEIKPRLKLSIDSNDRRESLTTAQYLEDPTEKEKKIKQVTDIKFPTYDDNIIDTELRFEITLDVLYSDIYSSTNVLLEFEKLYDDFITSEKSKSIIESFQNHNLNYLSFKLNTIILRRQITLISFLIKIKFALKDESADNINDLLKDYDKEEVEISKSILTSLLTINDKKINISVEEELELTELIKKHIENEKLIKNSLKNHSPSLSGLSITLKMLKSIVFKIMESLEKIKIKNSDENLILFFHTVNYNNKLFILL